MHILFANQTILKAGRILTIIETYPGIIEYEICGAKWMSKDNLSNYKIYHNSFDNTEIKGCEVRFLHSDDGQFVFPVRLYYRMKHDIGFATPLSISQNLCQRNNSSISALTFHEDHNLTPGNILGQELPIESRKHPLLVNIWNIAVNSFQNCFHRILRNLQFHSHDCQSIDNFSTIDV